MSNITPVSPPSSISLPTNTNVGLKQVSGVFGWMDEKIDTLINPRVIILILVVIFMGYFVINALAGGDNENDNKESALFANISILEIFLWAILIIVVLLNGFQYFFNTNITTEISDLLSTKPKITIAQSVPEDSDGRGDLGSGPSLKMRKQVFHIPSNIYDYENAKALCQAYGADIANIDQMEEAHKSGAEWCSYGWSDNQMILYPTQKSTWEELQKSNDPTKKNSCGRPGVNGGYIENATMKAGVNCYGPKPEMNQSSSKLMSSIQNVEAGKMLNPENEARVQEMRGKINDIVIAPFNKSAWSLL
jgi:hypothetical protein